MKSEELSKKADSAKDNRPYKTKATAKDISPVRAKPAAVNKKKVLKKLNHQPGARAPHEEGKNDFSIKVGKIEVNLTNQSKLYFPKDRVLKADVVAYYQSVYDYIIPYLKNRPQSLKRNPNGIADAGFYHKDAGAEAPEWVKSIPLYSESARKDIDYILCNDRATLMYLNNLGCIELNPWNSRTTKLDYPDYMVIDLDPSEKNTFAQVIETAQVVKEVLDKAGAVSYCKTSGATGLHVYVPMGGKYTYEQVREFAHVTALQVQEILPGFTTLERSLSKRKKNQLYLDYLQNKRGQTLVSVYSLRPREGATVSAPLEWKEVKKGLDPHAFNIRTMLKRIEKKGDLFKGVLGKGIDLRKVLKNMDR